MSRIHKFYLLTKKYKKQLFFSELNLTHIYIYFLIKHLKIN